MPRSRAIASGALALLSAQLVIAFGQVLYSGITARRVDSISFAEFAIALNLMGLLNLVLTVGLASIVMSRNDLTSTIVTKLRLLAASGGLLLAGSYMTLFGYWSILFGGASDNQFSLWLSVAVCVSPISAVESALYRRDARTVLDAVSMILAFLVSAGVACLLIVITHDAWPLALVPVLSPAVVLCWAVAFRRTRYPITFARSEPVSGFIASVGYQSSILFVISSIPLWALSVKGPMEVVGQYSRAAAITLLLATAMGTAINRAVQPYWRHISEDEAIIRGIHDSFLLTLWASVAVFGLLGVIAPSLVEIWLGPGWNEAGQFAILLAASCAIQVPVALLINALEMKGLFKVVRRAQIYSLLSTALPVFLLFALGEPLFGVAISLVSQVTIAGLLCWDVKVGVVSLRAQIRPYLFKELILLLLPVLAAGGFAMWISDRSSRVSYVSEEVLRILIPGALFASLLFACFVYSHAMPVMLQRVWKTSPRSSEKGVYVA